MSTEKQQQKVTSQRAETADFRPSGSGKGVPRAERLSVACVRRQQLAAMLLRGLSNKTMAGELGIGLPLVKYYLRTIYSHAGVSSSREWLTMQRLSKDSVQSL